MEQTLQQMCVTSRHLVIALDAISPGLCGLLIKEKVFNCRITIAYASLREERIKKNRMSSSAFLTKPVITVQKELSD